MGVQIPQGKGQFWGSSTPVKSMDNSLSAVIFAAKWIIQYARLVGLRLAVAGVTLYLPATRHPPLRCGLSSEFFDHLFFYFFIIRVRWLVE